MMCNWQYTLDTSDGSTLGVYVMISFTLKIKSLKKDTQNELCSSMAPILNIRKLQHIDMTSCM